MPQPLINISRKQALLFAGFLVLYEFLTYIANDMIMPGMLSVVHSFNAPESEIATSLTAYILGGSSLQLILGPLSDRFGRRPIMIFGACFFVVCTILIACSYSMNSFLVARFLQGMGLCFIGVIGYATLQEIFQEMDAIRLIAIMANVSILAPLLGPVIGALFIFYFNWRWIFVVISVFALVALWGLWRYMPESVGQVQHNGNYIEPSSLTTKKVLSNYGQLISNPTVMLGAFAIGLIALPCVIWIALAPIILIDKGHLSVIQYGLLQIPIFGASIMGNWILHRMTHRGSLRHILSRGSSVLCTSLGLLFLLPFLVNQQYPYLMPGLMSYFLGLSIVGAPLNRLVLFSTSVSKGTTAAFISMVSSLTQAIGIEIANIFFISSKQPNITFTLTCAIIGLLYLSILLIILFWVQPKQNLT